MDRSVTLRLPSLRRAAVGVAVVAVAAILLYVGVRFGTSVLGGGSVGGLAQGGDLQEVILANGTIYLGRASPTDDGYVRLSGPAIIRQQATGSGQSSAAPQVIVQALFSDPYGVSGDLLLNRDQVASIGSVDRGSGLANAYNQAFSGQGLPSTPSPSAP